MRWPEDRNLPFEAEYRAMHVWDFEFHARIVDQITCRKVIGTVNHDVVLGQDLLDVVAIKAGLNEADDTHSIGDAARAWFNLEESDQRALWLAPSKGGILTTEEKRKLQSSQVRESI